MGLIDLFRRQPPPPPTTTIACIGGPMNGFRHEVPHGTTPQYTLRFSAMDRHGFVYVVYELRDGSYHYARIYRESSLDWQN